MFKKLSSLLILLVLITIGSAQNNTHTDVKLYTKQSPVMANKLIEGDDLIAFYQFIKEDISSDVIQYKDVILEQSKVKATKSITFFIIGGIILLLALILLMFDKLISGIMLTIVAITFFAFGFVDSEYIFTVKKNPEYIYIQEFKNSLNILTN